MESGKVLTKKERRQLRQQGRVPHKLKELSKASKVLKADQKKNDRSRQPWNRPKNADGDPFPGDYEIKGFKYILCLSVNMPIRT